MDTFPEKARTAADGTLSRTDLAPGWPSGYFDEYFGVLRGEGIVRHPQGELEERQSLD